MTLWRRLPFGQFCDSHRTLLLGILFVAFCLRVALVSEHRFHPDEALYATWARLIATGEDPWLATRIVDKPPLLFYLMAIPFGTIGASEELARMPNLIAGTVTVALTAALCRAIYSDRRMAVIAALFVAVSPMAVLFSTTAFSDPMMLLWVIAAMVAAQHGRAGASGLLLGLAWATKQDAVLFAPLTAWLVVLRNSIPRRLFAFAGMLAMPVAAVALWSVMRPQPDYLIASLANFGGPALAAPSVYAAKAVEWLALVRWIGAEPLTVLAVATLPLTGWRQPSWSTWCPLIVGAAWIGLHIVFTFPVWDRFALPLVPLAGLVVARAAIWWLDHLAIRLWRGAAGAILVGLVVLPAIWLLFGGTPPVARDARHTGIDEIGEYFWRTDTTATILYVHGLGWEIDYYTFGRVLDRRWFATSAALAADAAKMHLAKRFLVLAAYEQLDEECGAALREQGLRTQVVLTTRQPSGMPAITLYQIVEMVE